MKWYNCILILLFLFSTAHAQVFIQIEKKNSPKTIKLSQGDFIEYKLVEYPDLWKSSEIIEIIPESKTIILEENFHQVEDFAAFRKNRKTVLSLGKKLIQFGVVWYVYGGVAVLASDFQFGQTQAIIGAIPIALGFLMRKIFGKRIFRFGKKYSLRIVDLRI